MSVESRQQIYPGSDRNQTTSPTFKISRFGDHVENASTSPPLVPNLLQPISRAIPSINNNRLWKSTPQIFLGLRNGLRRTRSPKLQLESNSTGLDIRARRTRHSLAAFLSKARAQRPPCQPARDDCKARCKDTARTSGSRSRESSRCEHSGTYTASR